MLGSALASCLEICFSDGCSGISGGIATNLASYRLPHRSSEKDVFGPTLGRVPITSGNGGVLKDEAHSQRKTTGSIFPTQG